MFHLEGGNDLECPYCSSKYAVRWDTEYSDPLVGDYDIKCPKCYKSFYFEVFTKYNVLTEVSHNKAMESQDDE
jgi:DNA-directed RNA polymerase subunit RPC12/RpoP